MKIKFGMADRRLMRREYDKGEKSQDIAAKWGISKAAVWRYLKSVGCEMRPSRRRHHIDEKFFDVIDTEAKAYFLGLLYADGYNSGKNVVEISLQERDKEILEAFQQHVGHAGKLGYRIRKGHRDGFDRQNQYRLALCSNHMAVKLTEHGCGPRKSSTLEFPTCVPDQLVRHFVRGYFDGDGMICLHKSGKYTIPIVNFISSKMFIAGLRKVINRELGFLPPIRRHHSVMEIWNLNFRCGKRARLIRSFMYDNSSPDLRLKRKWEKFQCVQREEDNCASMRGRVRTVEHRRALGTSLRKSAKFQKHLQWLHSAPEVFERKRANRLKKSAVTNQL